MEFWFRYLDSALCKAPLGDASQFSSSGGILDGTSLANAWWPALVGEQGLRRAGRPRRHPAFLSITKGRLFIVNVTAELSSQLDAEAEPLDSGSDHDDRGRGRGGAAAPTVNVKWSSSSDALAPAQPKSKSHASPHRSKSPTLVLPVPKLPPLHESPGSDDERGTTTTAAGTGAGAGPGAGASAGAPTYGKTKCKWEIVSTDIRMLTPPTSKVPRRLLISTGRNDFDVLFASPEQASSFNSHVMKLIDTKKSKMHRLLSERFKGEMMHVRSLRLFSSAKFF